MTATDPKKTEAPKWGTVEWIKAYPWSGMDRKRKRRVLAALPKDLAELLAQDAGYVSFLYAVVEKAGLGGLAAAKAFKRMQTIDVNAAKILDYAVAAALKNAWLGSATKTR